MNISFSTGELVHFILPWISNVKLSMTPISLHWSKSQTLKSRVSFLLHETIVPFETDRIGCIATDSLVSDSLLLHFSFFVFTMRRCEHAYTLFTHYIYCPCSIKPQICSICDSAASIFRSLWYIPDANVFALFWFNLCSNPVNLWENGFDSVIN